VRQHALAFALAALAGGSATSGCAASGFATGQRPALPMVRAEAERDLDCPGSEIRLEEELTGYIKAVGCGRKARYRAACVHLSCTVTPEGQAIPWRDRPEPDSRDPRLP
jgi:hypothetical protein